MKFIELTNDTRFVAVDDEDYEKLKSLNTDWYLMKSKSGQTIMSTKPLRGGGRGFRSILLHRFILGLHRTSMPLVDHINGDIFNATKLNLRKATRSQNGANRTKLNSNNPSGFAGVRFHKATNSYEYRVIKDRKSYSCSGFLTAEEAATARDVRAKELFKEFATSTNKNILC